MDQLAWESLNVISFDVRKSFTHQKRLLDVFVLLQIEKAVNFQIDDKVIRNHEQTFLLVNLNSILVDRRQEGVESNLLVSENLFAQ